MDRLNADDVRIISDVVRTAFPVGVRGPQLGFQRGLFGADWKILSVRAASSARETPAASGLHVVRSNDELGGHFGLGFLADRVLIGFVPQDGEPQEQIHVGLVAPGNAGSRGIVVRGLCLLDGARILTYAGSDSFVRINNGLTGDHPLRLINQRKVPAGSTIDIADSDFPKPSPRVAPKKGEGNVIPLDATCATAESLLESLFGRNDHMRLGISEEILNKEISDLGLSAELLSKMDRVKDDLLHWELKYVGDLAQVAKSKIKKYFNAAERRELDETLTRLHPQLAFSMHFSSWSRPMDPLPPGRPSGLKDLI